MKASSKVSISWLEIVLILLLVISALGTGISVEQQINQNLQNQEPSLKQFQQEKSTPSIERRFTAIKEELKTTQKILTEQRIELAKQNSKIESLQESYPQLLLPTTEEGVLPTEITKDYQSSIVGEATAQKLVTMLSSRVQELETMATVRSEELLEAQESASEKFEAAKTLYERKKRLRIASWSMGIGFSLTVIFSPILLVLKSINRTKLRIHVRTILFGAVAAQSILLGFQSFGVIGATLAVTALIVIFLLALSFYRV